MIADSAVNVEWYKVFRNSSETGSKLEEIERLIWSENSAIKTINPPQKNNSKKRELSKVISNNWVCVTQCLIVPFSSMCSN